MNILEELYYGNLDESSRKITESKEAMKQEFAAYDKLNASLNDEQKQLLEEFSEAIYNRISIEAMEDTLPDLERVCL